MPRDIESVNGGVLRDVRRDVTAMGDENEVYSCADQEEPQEANPEDDRDDRNDRDGDENRNDMNCSRDRSSQDEGNEQRDIEEEVGDEGQKCDEERSDREGSAGDRREGERSHDERDESERSDSERSEDNQSDGEGRDSEQSRVELQRRNTGDGIFSGEVYRPLRMISFNRGRCTRTKATTAHVVINYNVITATKCPCEDKERTKLVNVGTWGILGCGSTVCVHCGFKRQGGWQGSGYGFMGKEDYVRHLSSAKCRAARGMSTEKKNLKEVLGVHLYHKINDPNYESTKEDSQGNVKKYYKCFVCHRVVGYRSRHAHHVNANHGTDVNSGEDTE